jgi:hypothetical protein
VIRNAVLHLLNEQPLMADLETQPAPSDVVLVCTNLRTMNGTRPVFIDKMESIFIFPYSQVRFIELPRAATAGKQQPGDEDETASGRGPAPAAKSPERPPEPEADLEIDEDFLRRVREI